MERHKEPPPSMVAAARNLASQRGLLFATRESRTDSLVIAVHKPLSASTS